MSILGMSQMGLTMNHVCRIEATWCSVTDGGTLVTVRDGLNELPVLVYR